MLKDIWLRIYR